MTDLKHQLTEPEMKGWLHKWTNYLKGYQKRWFVLSNGLLSYYRTQAEMAHTCRGTISLHGAVIHTEDSCNFVISNGGTQTFHLKANSEVERQRWVTALELAKAKAIRSLESDDDDDELPAQPDKNELSNVLRTLSAKLEDLNTCNDLIVKHGAALQRSLSELEQLENPSEAASKIKAVNERATLFRITSNAMINACTDYLEMAQSQGRKWQKMLSHEHEQRVRLGEMVEQLARQHSHLEKAAIEAASTALSKTGHQSEEDEDNFYDALEHTFEDFVLPSKTHRRTASGISNLSIGSEGASMLNDESSSTESLVDGQEASVIRHKIANRKINSSTGTSNGRVNKTRSIIVGSHRTGSQEDIRSIDSVRKPLSAPVTPIMASRTGQQCKRRRRTVIKEKPNMSLNLWSIMKNCIGKELTKIPMPVNFNEPLSMLQRLTEDFEYSDILDRGAIVEDSCEQMAYVAAFTVSSYATTTTRTGKPFNPLLGETFECDRTDDYGWRSIAEQVSHHPPMASQFVEGREWTCWQEFTMSSKFRGKYLQIIPLGIAHLEFNRNGNHFTWRKVATTVQNIIVGKLWIDQTGEMEIINHKTGDKCHLKYMPYSYFSRDTHRKVTGIVTDAQGVPRWVLSGTWDEKMEAAKVLNSDALNKGKPIIETSSPKCLWKRRFPSPEAEKMYSFTELACQLNEMEEGIAPSDSRLRPDQRLMEEGLWNEANQEKVRLEEKQRTVRRKKEQEIEKAAQEGRIIKPYDPLWFKKQKDPWTGNPIHMYTHKYWEYKEKQDWSLCPTIY